MGAGIGEAVATAALVERLRDEAVSTAQQLADAGEGAPSGGEDAIASHHDSEAAAAREAAPATGAEVPPAEEDDSEEGMDVVATLQALAEALEALCTQGRHCVLRGRGDRLAQPWHHVMSVLCRCVARHSCGAPTCSSGHNASPAAAPFPPP